jgi:uncharacterized membrane protein
MTEEHPVVFVHLIGVFVFVGGVTAISTLRLAAAFQAKPSQVVTILSIARPCVLIVVFGLLLAIGAGLGAVKPAGHSFKDPWLHATFVLVVWMLLVGSVTGRMDRKTRELAESVQKEEEISSELRASLRNPISLSLNASMILSIFGVLGLMVWRPGV